MSKLLKTISVTILCAFLITGTTYAAFPLSKATKQPVTSTQATSVSPAEKTISTREIRKEVKAQMKAKGSDFGGGKSKLLAAVLCFFLGTIGIHSFYMGNTVKGIVQAGLTVLGFVLYIVGIAGYVAGGGVTFPVTALIGYLLILGVGIWALVDFIRILTGGLEPEDGWDS